MKLAVGVCEALGIEISEFKASCGIIRDETSVAEPPHDCLVGEDCVDHVGILGCHVLLNDFPDDCVVGEDRVNDSLDYFGWI